MSWQQQAKEHFFFLIEFSIIDNGLPYNFINCGGSDADKTLEPGLMLGLHPANERRRYFVTPSFIGWAQAYNQPGELFPLNQFLSGLCALWD